MTRAARAGQYNAGPQFESDGSISFSAGEPLVTRWTGTEYGPAERDTRVAQWIGWRKDLFVWSGTPTPQRDAMILTASRVDSLTGRRLPADLWITRRVNGEWTPPRPLGAEVNSERNDNFVFFSPRGDTLYFVRDFGRFYRIPLSAAVRDTVPGAAQASVVSIPFDYEDARVFVPVRVNGNSLRWFILDTGASPTIVDANVAAALHLNVTPAGSTTGAGTNSLRQGRAKSVSLSVGGIPLGPMDVVVSEIDSLLGPSQGRPAPGIIGSRFFMEHVVELDFAWPVMHVHDAKTWKYGGNGVQLPLTFAGGTPLIHGRLTTPDGTVIPMRLLVDLGAKSTLLVGEPFIDAHGLRAKFLKFVVSPLGAGVGGETRYAFTRAPRLALGTAGSALAADSVLVGLSVGGTIRQDWFDGLLGAEFLRGYRVIFDYARKRVIFEPRDPAPGPAAYDMSGMFVLATGADRKTFVVRSLVDGGPAAQAGITVGDTIVSVDGRPSAGMTLDRLRRILKQRDGVTVDVVTEHDGVRAIRAITLRRLI
jgi:hypothetical protein